MKWKKFMNRNLIKILVQDWYINFDQKQVFDLVHDFKFIFIDHLKIQKPTTK